MIASILALSLSSFGGTIFAQPVPLASTEAIVFLGDSITEQNLYAEYMETFLLSRFPDKKLACYNFGWGGDTAPGGAKRYGRDVAPVHPSLVFVDFGMNDGGYRPFEPKVLDAYLAGQRTLAAAIKAGGAREVLLTSTPTDEVVRADQGVYNQTLARLRDGLQALGRELQLPVLDLFDPMASAMRQARSRDPKASLAPDGVHPNPVGHLVMAYAALKGIAAPAGLGEVTVAAEQVSGRGALKVSRVAARGGGVEFDLELPFLPFYVPPEARPGLDLVPFERDLNDFRLRVPAAAGGDWALSVDGLTVGSFSPQSLREGVDLALLDRAPWAASGRALWETAQLRWQKHFEAWRKMDADKSAALMPDLASFAPLARAQRAYADELGASLQTLVRPKTFHLGLWPAGAIVPITSGELSPAYPLDGFAKAYPPEADPKAVRWKTVAFKDGRLNLAEHLGPLFNAVSYTRVILEAEAPCALHLAMGSDDGLAVLVDGKRVFAHDVMRGLKPGEDEAEVPLTKGRNELLFMVTQGGGDYALDVQARVRGRVSVRQVLPR